MNKIKRTGSVFFLNLHCVQYSYRWKFSPNAKKHQSQNCGKSDWKYEVYVFNVFSGMLL